MVEINKDTIVRFEAELKALSETLNKLDSDFKNASVDETFYYKKRQALVGEQEMNLVSLAETLEQQGAGAAASVLKKAVEAKPNEEEVKNQLIQVGQEAEQKGWGTKLVEKIKEHKGDVLDIAIKTGISVAKKLLGIP